MDKARNSNTVDKKPLKDFNPKYQSFFAKPLVLKSDLKTNVDRPHFNPSFLSPDFHNLSQGPHYEKSRWADHNQSRKDRIPGDHSTAFPQHPVHDDTFNETRRMKSAGRIPAITAAQYE